MLTPLDIHNKEFKRSFRGYNEDEIDEFLDMVVKDYETLYRENIDLKETVERLKSKVENFERLENTLHNTLVVAQETAEEVKLNANRESEDLRNSAKREAEDLRASAHREAELIVKEAQAKGKAMYEEAVEAVRHKNMEYQAIDQKMDYFRTQMKTLLVTQMQLLEPQKDEQKTTEPKSEPESEPPIPVENC